MELPSSEFSTIIAALGGDGQQKITMQGSFTAPPDNKGDGVAEHEEPLQEESFTEEPENELDTEEPDNELDTGEPDEESPESEQELLEETEELIDPDEPSEGESEMHPDDEPVGQDDNLQPEAELFSNDEEAEPGEPVEPDEQDNSIIPGSELPLEEEPLMEYERITAELSQPTTPRVNLLTNLINWVARAKREIGSEQMPIFLEVYGISGHLSPELKEAILHLSDMTSEQAEATNTSEIWSQLMLSLHGILTGGDAPLHPLKSSWNDVVSEMPVDEVATKVEEDKPKDMPLKLKLVFPNGDGKSKEFCLDLNPSVENNGNDS